MQVEGCPHGVSCAEDVGEQADEPAGPADPLIGREREIESVGELLTREDVRLLTLTGPGGTGKTRLALQAAADLIDEFADGVFFVSLAPISNADLVVPTLAQTLGLREQPGQPLLETVGQYLADKSMLLVLDNLEQVLESAPSIAALLAVAPGLRVLATSRAPLRVAAERLFEVPPLALPDLVRLDDAASLSRYEAVRLFIDRAQTVRADFAITAANAPSRRRDLRPARRSAARNRTGCDTDQGALARGDAATARPATQAAHRRQSGPRPAATDPPRDDRVELRPALGAKRQTSLRTARGLRRRLPHRRRGGGLPTGTSTPSTGSTSLVEKSLLRKRDDPDGEPRFWMLETIREYALDRLSARGEQESVEAVARRIRVALALQTRLKSRPGEASLWLSRLDAEQHNVRFVFDWLIERDRGDDAANVLHGVWFYWLARGRAARRIPLAEQAIDLSYSTALLRGYRARGRRRAAQRAGRLRPGEAAQGAGVGDLFRARRSRRSGATLTDLGVIAAAEGDLTQHVICTSEASRYARRKAREPGSRTRSSGLADVELRAGNSDAARAIVLRYTDLARQVGALQMVCGGLTDLGELERREGASPRGTEALP